MNVRTSFVILFLTFLVASTINAIVPYANGSSKSPYRSGYDHGCDDAKISEPDDRYINQPGKGPSFHTDEFMRGYNAGYDDCSNENENENERSDERSQSTSRSGGDDMGSVYRFTVMVMSDPSSDVDIDIETVNGYRVHAKVTMDSLGMASYTFSIPSAEGRPVRVCVDAGLLHFERCRTPIANTSVTILRAQ